MKSVVNLYTTIGCPKCNVLRKLCEESDFIKHSDFKEFIVDPKDKADTNLQLLIENKIKSFPVLLIDDCFYNFTEAMWILKNKKEDNEI